MSYKISSIPLFDRQAKRLAKKYPSLKQDLTELMDRLISQPEQVDLLGNNIYKIRLSIASKVKVNRVAQGLLTIPFFLPLNMTNLKKVL